MNLLEDWDNEDTSQLSSLTDLIAQKKAKGEKSFVELRADRLREIKEKFELPDKGTLYYPACGVDNSPSIGLPEWKITYMDAVDLGISGMNQSDTLIKGDLMSPPFNPDETQFDIVMLVSPGAHFSSFTPEYIEKTIQFLKPNGLLICDDYHNTATDIVEMLESTLKKVDENESELKVFKKNEQDIPIHRI